MVRRDYWIQVIENAWRERSIVWLAGVRRVGKTFLCQSLENTEYFDCERPRIRNAIEEDPEGFLNKMQGKRIVLDEIHRLENPSELLKIAADHYPTTQIIATGSSTLEASKKFRDTLTGRKRLVHLTPMLYHELAKFDGKDLEHRLLNGGLPPFFLQDEPMEVDFQEWLSSYWAKDVQELFRVEKRHAFLKFVELILAQSGSMFEATRFTAPCEIGRAAISNYLSILEETYLLYVVRPFSSSPRSEIVSAPKVYGFDTGFVCHARGWSRLRREDLGYLWEHIVLNELRGRFQTLKIHYWRDKRGHEIDFVILNNRDQKPITIECKWNAAKFDSTNLRAFRRRYPDGKNYIISPGIELGYEKNFGGIQASFACLNDLIHDLEH